MKACVRIENMIMPVCCGQCRLMKDRYCVLLDDGASYVEDMRRRRHDCPLVESFVLDEKDFDQWEKEL